MNPAAAFHGPIPNINQPPAAPDPVLVACRSWATHYDAGYCQCLCTKCFNRDYRLCSCPNCKHHAQASAGNSTNDFSKCLAEGVEGIERVLFGEPDYTPVPVAGQDGSDSYIDHTGHIRIRGRQHQEARQRQYLAWVNKGKKNKAE